MCFLSCISVELDAKVKMKQLVDSFMAHLLIFKFFSPFVGNKYVYGARGFHVVLDLDVGHPPSLPLRTH